MILKGKEINRRSLIHELQEGTCRIYFRKVTNGRFRSLYCTLDPLKIVPKNSTIGITNQIRNYDLLPVFDLVSNSWKSFYISNVMGVYTEMERDPIKRL